MTDPFISLASMLFLVSTAQVPLSAARAHGLWKGQELSLLVDTCRLQGRFGDAQVFTREPLRVIDTTDRFVVFFIGEKRFIGMFDGDTAEVTGDAFLGSVTLNRLERLGAHDEQLVYC